MGKRTRRKKPPTERFLALVHPEPNTGCWLWASSTTAKGYGSFKVSGKSMAAHRYSFEHFNGPLHGLCVLHRCDTPACVNPAHLFLGTQLDNVKDTIAKGRKVFRVSLGEKNGQRRLSLRQVRAIRQSSDSNVALGRQFGVTEATVRRVRSGETWGAFT